MIRWVHELGKEWGRSMRSHANGYPQKSLMARIQEEGSVGAAIKTHFRSIPVNFMTKDAQVFHRAWMTLRESQRQVLFVSYVIRAPFQVKAERLGISKSRYYQIRDAGLEAVASKIPASLDSARLQ